MLRYASLLWLGLMVGAPASAGGHDPATYPVAGSPGCALHQPNFVDVDTQGNVYVADPDTVRKFDRAGNCVASLSIRRLGRSIPGIAVDRDGSLWLSDVSGARLEHARFGSDAIWSCSMDTVAGFEHVRPFALRVDNRGVVWMTDYRDPSDGLGGVVRFDPGTGTWSHVWTAASGASGFDFGRGERMLYVAETGRNRVVQIDENGTILAHTTIDDSVLNTPEGVAVAPSGTVYVVSKSCNCVQTFDSRLRYQGPAFPGAPALADPMGLTLRAAHDLYVVEANSGRISLFRVP